MEEMTSARTELRRACLSFQVVFAARVGRLPTPREMGRLMLEIYRLFGEPLGPGRAVSWWAAREETWRKQ